MHQYIHTVSTKYIAWTLSKLLVNFNLKIPIMQYITVYDNLSWLNLICQACPALKSGGAVQITTLFKQSCIYSNRAIKRIMLSSQLHRVYKSMLSNSFNYITYHMQCTLFIQSPCIYSILLSCLYVYMFPVHYFNSIKYLYGFTEKRVISHTKQPSCKKRQGVTDYGV